MNNINDAPLNNPIVLLALLLAGGFIIYCIIRSIKRISKKNTSKSSKKSKHSSKSDSYSTDKQTAEKEEAIAKFRQIHQKARDNRKKLAQEIDANPSEATKAFRRMMKH